jgi:hypothetical protein
VNSKEAEFMDRIVKTMFTAKVDLELFTEGRNLVDEIINDAFRRLIPLGDHKSTIKSKINQLEEIGFLPKGLAQNCKTIYDIGTLFNHPKKNPKTGKIMTRAEKFTLAKDKCNTFQDTASAELLRNKKRPWNEKYAEACINTLYAILYALERGHNAYSLGKVISKSQAKKQEKKNKIKSKKK